MMAWKAGVNKYFRDCMAKTRQRGVVTAGIQGRSSGGRERKKKKKKVQGAEQFYSCRCLVERKVFGI